LIEPGCAQGNEYTLLKPVKLKLKDTSTVQTCFRIRSSFVQTARYFQCTRLLLTMLWLHFQGKQKVLSTEILSTNFVTLRTQIDEEFFKQKGILLRKILTEFLS